MMRTLDFYTDDKKRVRPISPRSGRMKGARRSQRYVPSQTVQTLRPTEFYRVTVYWDLTKEGKTSHPLREMKDFKNKKEAEAYQASKEGKQGISQSGSPYTQRASLNLVNLVPTQFAQHLAEPRVKQAQKMSLYEVYYDSNKKQYRQKVLKTRPATELNILVDEQRQFKEQTKNVQGVDFTIAPSGTRLRL